MNKVWTRYEGLIMTYWKLGQKLPIENPILTQSILSCVRTGEALIYNDKPYLVNSIDENEQIK